MNLISCWLLHGFTSLSPFGTTSPHSVDNSTAVTSSEVACNATALRGPVEEIDSVGLVGTGPSAAKEPGH